MILIDYRDSRPIYEQVVDKFRLLILKGVLNKDDKMPSVRSLAMELSINPNTIQRAYNELERQGCIYTVKGRGNFISDPESLKEEYRREIFEKLDDVCDLADRAGVSTKELTDHIEDRSKTDGCGSDERDENTSDEEAGSGAAVSEAGNGNDKGDKDNGTDTGKEGEQS